MNPLAFLPLAFAAAYLLLVIVGMWKTRPGKRESKYDQLAWSRFRGYDGVGRLTATARVKVHEGERVTEIDTADLVRVLSKK